MSAPLQLPVSKSGFSKAKGIGPSVSRRRRLQEHEHGPKTAAVAAKIMAITMTDAATATIIVVISNDFWPVKLCEEICFG